MAWRTVDLDTFDTMARRERRPEQPTPPPPERPGRRGVPTPELLDRAHAERAARLATRIGTARAADLLGVHRNALAAAWEHHGIEVTPAPMDTPTHGGVDRPRTMAQSGPPGRPEPTEGT